MMWYSVTELLHYLGQWFSSQKVYSCEIAVRVHVIKVICSVIIIILNLIIHGIYPPFIISEAWIFSTLQDNCIHDWSITSIIIKHTINWDVSTISIQT